jgi:hypothetical protein
MYFLFFVYLINNMKTRLELRSVIWAVFVGFIISASTVVAFFYLGYGTKASIFSSLKDEPAVSKSVGFKPGKPTQFNGVLTLGNERGLKVSESAIKRSQGMFRHPAIAASICGLILPIVLAYLVAARRNRDRILFFMVFILGVAGLMLTFSRAGAIGFAVGTVASYRRELLRLISRRVLIVGFCFDVAVAPACIAVNLLGRGWKPFLPLQ